jgi:hypothetical protein
MAPSLSRRLGIGARNAPGQLCLRGRNVPSLVGISKSNSTRRCWRKKCSLCREVTGRVKCSGTAAVLVWYQIVNRRLSVGVGSVRYSLLDFATGLLTQGKQLFSAARFLIVDLESSAP